MATEKNMKQLVAVVERGKGNAKKNWWTRIGVAFENNDGSWNLRFDYLPTDPNTTIQIRDFDPKSDQQEGAEAAE